MDDQRAHFLTMLGDACLAAGLANLIVEVRTTDGVHASGVPSPRTAGGDTEGLNETGFANGLLINGHRVRLEDIDSFCVRGP